MAAYNLQESAQPAQKPVVHGRRSILTGEKNLDVTRCGAHASIFHPSQKTPSTS